jgi:cytochrome P450
MGRSMADRSLTRFAPGPRPVPLIGNLLDFRGDGMALGFFRYWPRLGDVIRFRFGVQEAVALVHPEHTRQVFIKNRGNYVKGISVESLTWLTGAGLFTADGELWQTQRRMMHPHFTPAATRNYESAMLASVAETVARLAASADGRVVDMQFELMRFTMDVICRTMFSMSIAEGASELSEAITEALHWVGVRGLQVLRLSPAVPTPANLRFRRACRQIDAFLDDLIAARTRGGEVGARGDLLDLLLQATDEVSGRGMSRKQLRDEMVTIFLAGHETTAVAMTWTLALLASHRFAEDALLAELSRALGGRDATTADLPALGYTRQLIDEALRLYPPVWVDPRQAVDADEIGGFTVVPGAIIMPMVFAAHRHPEFWPDPERFDPERFTPERCRERHPCAYLPFGAGHRVCLGMNFAQQEMVLLLANLAQRFRMTLAPGQQMPVDPFASTLRPKYGLHMHVAPRR